TPWAPTASKKPSKSSGPERISTRPPCSSIGISWLLQPVTWNRGTETRVEISGPSLRSVNRQRNAFSLFVVKLACEVIAPVGQPNGHAIAAVHALGPKASGDACGAVPQLAVGDRRAAHLDERGRTSVAIDARAEHVHEGGRSLGVARDAIGAPLDAGLIEW